MDQTNTESLALNVIDADSPVAELGASLLNHIRLAEARMKGITEEEQIELGCRYHSDMLRHAEWTLCYAAYLGVTLKSLFQGKKDQAKERICKQVTGYSLSQGRRFVKFVDNLPLIEQEAERKGLVMKEIGVSGCLDLVPKKKGCGGRPPKGKRQQVAVSAQTKIKGNGAAASPESKVEGIGLQGRTDSVSSKDGSKHTDGDSDEVAGQDQAHNEYEADQAEGEQQLDSEEVQTSENKPSAVTAKLDDMPEREASGDDTISKLADDALDNFRPILPLQEIRERVAKGEAAIFLVVTVQAVATDADKSILGQGTAETTIKGTWLDAASEADRQVKKEADDKDKYF
jgi:hypothetical protein